MLNLEQALRAVITEARSYDGIGTSIYAALEVAEHTRQQLAALDRIVSELRDDGITEEALAAAEATLSQAPMDSLIAEISDAAQQMDTQPRYTSLHEAYSALAQQIHAFFDAGREFLPGRRDPSVIRVEAVRIAALAVKAVKDLRLTSVKD